MRHGVLPFDGEATKRAVVAIGHQGAGGRQIYNFGGRFRIYQPVRLPEHGSIFLLPVCGEQRGSLLDLALHACTRATRCRNACARDMRERRGVDRFGSHLPKDWEPCWSYRARQTHRTSSFSLEGGLGGLPPRVSHRKAKAKMRLRVWPSSSLKLRSRRRRVGLIVAQREPQP